VYTFTEPYDREVGDTCIVVSRAELANLKYVLGRFGEVPGSSVTPSQVAFWLSVLDENPEEKV